MLALAMGISRFSYTPILPFMTEATDLTIATAGYLASSNYVGYLIGALLAGKLRGNLYHFTSLSVACNIISMIAMGMTDTYVVWLFMRFVAGITSGIIFVLVSSIVLDYLTSKNLGPWIGFLYSGVGVGIVVSGLLVPIFHKNSSWEGAWIYLGILSIMIAIIVFLLWKGNVTISSNTPKSSSVAPKHPFLIWIIFVYSLEGFGYIITATFLVDIVYSIPSLQEYASYSWVVVGISVIPSTYLWMLAMKKWSPITVLCTAFFIQAVGVLLPILSETVIGVFIAAFLFGITFMGITTICTSYARQISLGNSNQILGKMTTFYALGQVLGPLFAGWLAGQSGSYKSSILLAGGILLIAIPLLLIGTKITNARKEEQSCHT